MVVILGSVFSAVIIFITVFYMMQAFTIAYKKNELSLRRFIIFPTTSIVIGLLFASVIPAGYQKVVDYIQERPSQLEVFHLFINQQ